MDPGDVLAEEPRGADALHVPARVLRLEAHLVTGTRVGRHVFTPVGAGPLSGHGDVHGRSVAADGVEDIVDGVGGEAFEQEIVVVVAASVEGGEDLLA